MKIFFQIFFQVFFRDQIGEVGLEVLCVLWKTQSTNQSTTTDYSDEPSMKSISELFELLYCPAVFDHFSPAPVKTDQAVRIQ